MELHKILKNIFESVTKANLIK